MDRDMAPEIEAGSPHDMAADIWSLGQIAFQLLCCAKEPVRLSDTLLSSQSETTSRWNQLDGDVKDLITCMVDSNPEARPSI